MTQSDSMLETVITHAKQIIPSIQDLKRIASKKGTERGQLIEKCTAIIHSFNVYTYSSSTFRESKEAQTFQQKVNDWIYEFKDARFDFEGEVNEQRVIELYDEVVESYNEMVTTLGFEHEKLR